MPDRLARAELAGETKTVARVGVFWCRRYLAPGLVGVNRATASFRTWMADGVR